MRLVVLDLISQILAHPAMFGFRECRLQKSRVPLITVSLRVRPIGFRSRKPCRREANSWELISTKKSRPNDRTEQLAGSIP
jgi:hypothetical protein